MTTRTRNPRSRPANTLDKAKQQEAFEYGKSHIDRDAEIAMQEVCDRWNLVPSEFTLRQLAVLRGRVAAGQAEGRRIPTDALEFVTRVRDCLASAKMPRVSKFNGGELRGWTTAYGSTGFSIRRMEDGRLDLHIVISGKTAGLQYREWTEWGDDGSMSMHEPTNAESLHSSIRAALEAIGLTVHDVRYTGAQQHWDDDVDYNVTIDNPGIHGAAK